MLTFWEDIEVREGLWLADKNAVLGMTRINPFPAKHAQLKRISPIKNHSKVSPAPVVFLRPLWKSVQ
jgi:hypothetical protein